MYGMPTTPSGQADYIYSLASVPASPVASLFEANFAKFEGCGTKFGGGIRYKTISTIPG